MADDVLSSDPLAGSKYMCGRTPIAPLHVWKGMTAEQLLRKVYERSSYEADSLSRANKILNDAIGNGHYLWTSIAGALTPTGLGGLVSQMIDNGHIDGIVMTGANAFHDLHFVFGLPVRQGTEEVYDADVSADDTTRIHRVWVRNKETLCAQDMFNKYFAKKVAERVGDKPLSTAEFMYEFGKELLADESGRVKHKDGSIVLSAAKHGVPLFLDSAYNHSLGMDLSALYVEGTKINLVPFEDIIQSAALSVHCQPQYNFCIGEGGPRNFLQTTGPTASEIFGIPFEGSAGCVILSVSDVRAGALSGSTKSEADTWKKYGKDAASVVVWGEFTLTLPPLAASIIDKQEPRMHKRLMDKLPDIKQKFLEAAATCRAGRDAMYLDLEKRLGPITAYEAAARKKD